MNIPATHNAQMYAVAGGGHPVTPRRHAFVRPDQTYDVATLRCSCSLNASGRSRSGRCTLGCQTVAQAGPRSPGIYTAIVHTGSFHSHRSAFLLPALCKRARLDPSCGRVRTSSRAGAEISSRPHSNIYRQHLQRARQSCPEVLLQLSVLSSITVLDGFDPNENGLTDAQGSFAPGAKSYD